MDVAVKVNEDEKFAAMVAAHLADSLKPVIQDMVNKAVEDAMPGRGLTQRELSRQLHLAVGTEAFDRIAYGVGMPRYRTGTKDRWYSKAVDKFMETYTEV